MEIEILFFELGRANPYAEQPPLKVRPYQTEQDNSLLDRFLYWEAEGSLSALLVTSAQGNHLELRESAYDHFGWKHERRLTGAGWHYNGQLFWNSTGLGLETPVELRPIISKALGFPYLP